MTDKAEALEEIITLLAVPPISNLHRQAASMLTAQAAEMKWLKGQTSVYDALKVQINSRDTFIASQAAEIAALRAYIQTGRDLVPRFQFLFPTSGDQKAVYTMRDVLIHLRAENKS